MIRRRAWLVILVGMAILAAGCFSAPNGTVQPTPLRPSMASTTGLAQSYHPLWESDTELAAEFDTIVSTGAKWVRFDFYWAAVQPAGPGRFDWSLIDRAVNAARFRGLNVLGTLAYTPAWARPGTPSDHYPPADPDDYANFARAAAQRYAPQGVRAWEIWNEPNISDFWQPLPDVAAYTELLKRASAAIRSVDPGAAILTGGTAPAGGTLDWASPDGTEVSPWRFLFGVYQNGGASSFTAVAHHPYTGMPYPPSTQADWNSFQQTRALHDLMAWYGDANKQIWGTEAGAWTGTSQYAITEDQQAEYVREYLALWNAWPFTGPFFYYSLRDRGTDLTNREDNFGLLRYDRTEKPAMGAFRQALTG